MRILQSPWTAAGLGTAIYLAVLVVAWKPHMHSAEVAASSSVRAPRGPSWTFASPEADLLIEELRKEKEALKAKTQDMQDLIERLESERKELYHLTQVVYQVQSEFDTNVIRVREQEAANLKKLAKLYSTMEPEGAAAIFKELDEPTLVKILGCMREAETAAVLSVMARGGEAEAKRVAALSERIRLALPETKKAAVQ